MSVTPETRSAAASAMARWSAKTLLIAAGVTLVAGALWYARAATVPLVVAALVSTQVYPLVGWMTRHGLNHGLAVAASLIGVVVVMSALAWLFADSLFGNLGGLGEDISKGVDQVLDWADDNSTWVAQHDEEIRQFLSSLWPATKEAAGGVFTIALGGLSLAAQLISTALLTLVFLLYFMTGGRAVWEWVMGRFAPSSQPRVASGGAAAWHAAGGYIRGIALVASIDSLFIGIGMLVIGTPHAGTLVLLSFVCLFVPILGAWVSGTVIVLTTLAAQGSSAALAMAIVILVGQQLDSMFVTPLVYQQTVNLHPIVTLGGVIIGTQLMGIIGAFLTVPMIAVGWAVWNAIEQPRVAEVPLEAPAMSGPEAQPVGVP